MGEKLFQAGGVWSSGADEGSKKQWILVREIGANSVGLSKDYYDAQMTPNEARWLASELQRLANRVDVRNGVIPAVSAMGAAGGRARAATLPPERRSEIARAAANKRWEKKSVQAD